ncbi:MAG: 5'-nucleotidase C-terminal domain-containing protein [Candidatus Latescibacterota bacterium]|nr:MAG: 5'-nucleotidase C-terminal domain-containing protein [Candidatus Latescibacterota bacterium]
MNTHSCTHARALASTLCVALLLLQLLGCGREREVTLLSFNDFHGALVHGGIEPESQRPWGGATALVTRIRAERRAHPRRTFLLDAGDTMQGTPESNFFFGRTTIELWNRVGVDAAALGNHEFDWGIDTLRARVAQMRYPLLAANVFELDGRRPDWVRAATILERDGIRLGVVGFATPETPRVTLPQNVATLRFVPPERIAQAVIDSVRAQGVDLLMILCHIGATQEPDTLRGPLVRLAHSVRDVDAIVGGHTHTRVAGSAAGVPIVVANSRGRGLGKIVLHWNGRRVTRAEVAVVPIFSDSLRSPHAAVASFVDSVRSLVRPYATRVLARAPHRLDVEALANVVTDAMRAAVGADVALTNVGGLRTSLQAGPITEGDLFELIPFENTLVTARLHSNELRALLESQPQHARVSGLRFTYEPKAAAGERLRALRDASGGVFDARRDYLVVTNNFLAHGGDGFHGFLDGRDVTWTDLRVRDVVRDWIVARAPAGELLVDSRRRTGVESAD